MHSGDEAFSAFRVLPGVRQLRLGQEGRGDPGELWPSPRHEQRVAKDAGGPCPIPQIRGLEASLTVLLLVLILTWPGSSPFLATKPRALRSCGRRCSRWETLWQNSSGVGGHRPSVSSAARDGTLPVHTVRDGTSPQSAPQPGTSRLPPLAAVDPRVQCLTPPRLWPGASAGLKHTCATTRPEATYSATC